MGINIPEVERPPTRVASLFFRTNPIAWGFDRCPLWVKADICSAQGDVRFTPESGHCAVALAMSALCQ